MPFSVPFVEFKAVNGIDGLRGGQFGGPLALPESDGAPDLAAVVEGQAQMLSFLAHRFGMSDL